VAVRHCHHDQRQDRSQAQVQQRPEIEVQAHSCQTSADSSSSSSSPPYSACQTCHFPVPAAAPLAQHHHVNFRETDSIHYSSVSHLPSVPGLAPVAAAYGGQLLTTSSDSDSH
jgi:hypothetical protein